LRYLFEITSQLPRLRLLSVVVSIVAASRCLLRVYLTLFVEGLPYVLFAIMASSSMFDNQVVTQALIILEKQGNWKLWYSMKKQFATIKGVWEYCDPSTTKQPPTIDDEPSDKDSDSTWRKWEIKTNAQRATLKALGEVNLEIMRTVARSKLHLITELDLNVRLRLKALQDYFKITSQQQVLELSSQYTAIQHRQRLQEIDTWLNEYSRISSLC
jgi:hypothetical protein